MYVYIYFIYVHILHFPLRTSYSKKVLKNVHYFQFLPLSRFPGDTAFKSPKFRKQTENYRRFVSVVQKTGNVLNYKTMVKDLIKPISLNFSIKYAYKKKGGA